MMNGMKVPTYDSRSSLRDFHISLGGMQTKLAQADILFGLLGAARKGCYTIKFCGC